MINTYVPKISCLLVTNKGRFEYFKKSVHCYVDQTYPHKELLIINEGPNEYQQILENFICNLNRPDIRMIWLNGVYSLGSLRNISIGLAEGEIFCQWDDDDFCTPQRLATQYSYLVNKNSKVCYLSDQFQYFYKNNLLYWSDWNLYGSADGVKQYALIPGTIMAYKQIWHDYKLRYPTNGKYCKAGEDTELANDILRHLSNSVFLLNGLGNMHVYTCHGDNQVFDYRHHMEIPKLRSHNRKFIIKNRDIICKSLDYFKLGKEIKVMCRDGLAFTYRNEND